MSRAHRILVVDDEQAIRRLLAVGLAAQGYVTSEAADGAEAIAKAAAEKPDLVILDLGLPDMDGNEVIRRLRRVSATPIIVLSVRNDEKGKVLALDLGADDYVTKPFGMEELVARIRTALRRRWQEQGVAPVYRAGELSVDLVHRRVAVAEREVKLSAKEYDLLKLLVTQAGKVLTHNFILREVWGPAHTEDVQYLRVYIRTLRHKLGDDPAQPRYIQTEMGVGYRLRAADEAAVPG
ncbi:MAG TPA: response regulator transcription factor [Alphaproteobacteria bacterium]|nr:response regulator transcription factor [Alphaproteobacteria bacterium]